MEKIALKKSFEISKLFKTLNINEDKQKTLELSHLCKFMMFFKDLSITELSEKPDFILKNKNKTIGIEHQIVVNKKYKEKEGYYQNIFNKAIEILKENKDLPDFLVNCQINENFKFKSYQKQNIIELVSKIIEEYVLNEYLMDNPIIEEILMLPHSQKSASIQFDEGEQNWITEKIIYEAINKKELKLKNYLSTNIDEQWLLLVIGSLKNSSYEINMNLKMEIESKFDKIYILEDFNKNLYQLK